MNLSRRCEIPTTLRFFSIPSPAYIRQYIRAFYIYYRRLYFARGKLLVVRQYLQVFTRYSCLLYLSWFNENKYFIWISFVHGNFWRWDWHICDPEVMNLLIERSGFYNYYESYLIWYDVFIHHNMKNCNDTRFRWKREMVFVVSSIVLFSLSIMCSYLLCVLFLY
jgi:hypothetical protein